MYIGLGKWKRGFPRRPIIPLSAIITIAIHLGVELYGISPVYIDMSVDDLIV